MRVQDAGAERRAPGLQGWGGGGGETHADVEGTAGEGLSPPDYALHPPPPPLPAPPCLAMPCGGGGALQSGAVGRERRRPAPPTAPCLHPGRLDAAFCCGELLVPTGVFPRLPTTGSLLHPALHG